MVSYLIGLSDYSIDNIKLTKHWICQQWKIRTLLFPAHVLRIRYRPFDRNFSTLSSWVGQKYIYIWEHQLFLRLSTLSSNQWIEKIVDQGVTVIIHRLNSQWFIPHKKLASFWCSTGCTFSSNATLLCCVDCGWNKIYKKFQGFNTLSVDRWPSADTLTRMT